ncbi:MULTISPECIES: mechanosensitive ion channel family protein [Sphingobium]|jgi:small conductance mechanosensitive channel|uniref:mechanosensitive ion channel family protein n=1 Tax=Sphingobium TaxID=165695 RepID=UPI000C495EB7|nr:MULTISPECIES: mechanosensitive ion channel [Sphingobium]MBA37372.1 mechanosensitive ion channel protein MscS [Sphingobium sp.]MBS48009.1 mechanosensitive ion channel protein MscS [Sphingobium sp.]MCC4255517.1 mechanosensitive ion channel [Sphingobium lactosutens]MEC9017226.1 mechanosensitive ion channel [Pseudomonadota bacterium]|tara:strand:- start:119 stop:997 length:879 start_codon:yes stop_codon:yes gene_type:complete
MTAIDILAKQLWGMWAGFVALVPNMVIALVILGITWVVSRVARRIVDRVTGKASIRESLKQLIHTVVSIGVWVVGLVIAATVVLPGLTPASLVAGLGVGTIAIGFAFQDFFQNFLAGILIMVRKKMRIGDIIECEGIIGRVEHVSLRETHVRKLSNELTIVPNSTLFKNPVEILTDGAQRRHEIIVGVSYDTDLEQARDVIRAAMEGIDVIDQDRRIDIFAREFNASSIDFLVRWWAGSKPYDMHDSRDRVVRAIKAALDEAGIEIPFPYVTNIFKGPVPLKGQVKDDVAQA